MPAVPAKDRVCGTFEDAAGGHLALQRATKFWQLINNLYCVDCCCCSGDAVSRGGAAAATVKSGSRWQRCCYSHICP